MSPGILDVSLGFPALAQSEHSSQKRKTRAPAFLFSSKWSIQMAGSAEPAVGSRGGKDSGAVRRDEMRAGAASGREDAPRCQDTAIYLPQIMSK